MKLIEVGKKYLNRKGVVVEISYFSPNESNWPFLGSNGAAYTPEGFNMDKSYPSDKDLIEEVVPAPTVETADYTGPSRDELAAQFFTAMITRNGTPRDGWFSESFEYADQFIAEAKRRGNP